MGRVSHTLNLESWTASHIDSAPRPSQTNTPAAGTLVGRLIAFCWESEGWCVGKVVAGASAKDLRRGFNYLVQYTSESVHRLHCLNIDSKYDSGAEAEPECSAAGVSKSC